jgi:FRG domain
VKTEAGTETVFNRGPAAFYGIRSWCAWTKHAPVDLKPAMSTPTRDWMDNDVLDVDSYFDLVKVIAFFSVMNKIHTLAFRGQALDQEPMATLCRDSWRRPTDGGTEDLSAARFHYWEQLNDACERVSGVLKGRLPRHRPFEWFRARPELRVAPWSVIQHHELWPTPMLDLTTSPRVAASFALALPHPRREGFLYVFALPDPRSDVMRLRSTTREVAVRLSAVCPPETLRPHLQEGVLVGNPKLRQGRSRRSGDLTRSRSPRGQDTSAESRS